jgi:hypothetical protein
MSGMSANALQKRKNKNKGTQVVVKVKSEG